MKHLASIAFALAFGISVGGQTTSAVPADVAQQLLATDRAYSDSSAAGDAIAVLGRAFADDVVLPERANPDRAASFAHGRTAALEALRRDAGLTGARLAWTPIRAGISADGLHGFTYGYTTLTRADGTEVPGKYVAYWTRALSGAAHAPWRISVYRRVARPAGDVSLAERPPALPPRLVAARDDAASLQRLRDELASTERAFSRDAKGGASIGEAFARYGDPTAANVGDAAAFTFGPAAIGASVQASVDASKMRITWGPEETRVASSGDLGVTIGFITIERIGNAAAPESFRVPFFTIWRRDDRSGPWRYVAE